MEQNAIKRLVIAFLLAFVLVGGVFALPTTGAASDISFNGFNVSVTGITGTEVWLRYGNQPTIQNWKGAETTVGGSDATITLNGGFFKVGETLYFKACDETGCGDVKSATLTTPTTLPTVAGRSLFTNITRSHFDPLVIGASLLGVYMMLAGQSIAMFMAYIAYAVGTWFRTKSVKMIMIVGIIVLGFIISESSGLRFGMPVVGVMVTSILVVIGMAGIIMHMMQR